MVVMGEKLCGGPMDRSASMLRIVSGAIFLECSKVRPTLLGQRQMLPCTGTTHKKCTSGICGLAQKTYVSCVSDFPL
jgi:hypothetical protein